MTTRTKEYILTESGNHISRAGLNLVNTQSIVLGGKTILEGNVTIRGDLCRVGASSAVTLGRYCRISHHASLVPPHRDQPLAPTNANTATTTAATTTASTAGEKYETHEKEKKKGEEDGKIEDKKWYPLKIGDYVHVGAHSTVSAASIASYVYIGDRCVVGNMCIIKEGSILEDDTILPPYSVVAPYSRVAGSPGLLVGECPEVMVDVLRDRAREHYADVLAV